MPKGLKSLARLLDELPFAPVVAIMFGLVVGILVIATPGWLFERTFLASGLPPIVVTAASLGIWAQTMTAIFAASGTTGFLWLMLRWVDLPMKPIMPRSRGHRIEPFYKPSGDEGEIVSIARRPLFANAELGVPAMSCVPVTQTRDELVLDMSAAIGRLRTGQKTKGSRPTLPVDIADRGDLDRGSQLLH
jgi:hypothetical protein